MISFRAHFLLGTLCLVLLLPGNGNAQLPTEAVPEGQLIANTSFPITVGRLWWATSCAANYAETYVPNVISYPGYYEAPDHMDMIAPFIMFLNQGTNAYINLEERNIGTYGGAQVPFAQHNNYNFAGDGGINEAEQWGEGVFQTFIMQSQAPDQPQGAVLITTKSMAWSVPEYDDFVIHKVKMKNVDNVPFTDFYYNMPAQVRYGQIVSGRYRFLNDMEYQWDPDREVFLFYDDVQWLRGEAAPVGFDIYQSPGNTTGDAGDPGNITQAGSLDRRLYQPEVRGWGIENLTYNGMPVPEKVHYNILAGPEASSNSGRGAISDNTIPAREWGQLRGGSNLDRRQTALSHDQERANWRDLWNDPSRPKDGTVDGSLFERSPLLYSYVGPFDMQPGDEIEFIAIYCFGEMDRNISQLGGLAATQVFQEQGIAAFKANYDAAMELIANDFKLPEDAYPPPTVGTQPFINDGEPKLEVVAFADAEAGTQGFDLTWRAVPDSYRDQGTGADDFAGYRVYRSEIHITGPWVRVDDISRSEAEAFRSGDNIVYRSEADPGIPYRYGVSSYDTQGLESGMTAYSFFAQEAPRAPSNDMAKIRVVPNPFRQRSGFLDVSQNNRLAFVNIPAKCTIRIYTLAGDLIKIIEHDAFGETAWGSQSDGNYLQTDFSESPAAGLYIYHVTSHVAGQEGQSHVGKFMIIR